MTVLLFGRSAEVKRLEEALAGVAAGRACLALIEGEPGIGKSALLGEATLLARGLGFRTFAGRAEELEQDRPFHSIAEALGCARAGSDERRTEIAGMLGSPSEGDGVIYRLIDAFEDLVEAEALNGPTLLAIDDLQWADSGTVRALGSIVRRMSAFPVAIIATLRRTPRTDDLGALLRGLPPNAIRIWLEALDRAAVTEMVRARVGTTPGAKLRAHVDGAGGNPFFITELIDTLRAESAILVDGGRAEIQGPALPPSLVVTILHRLSVLSDRTLEVLRSAAVLGSSFKVDDLATAAEVAHGEVIDAVQVLRAEGVLTDEGGKVRFRHDLIREAVYGDLGEPVRASMHRRIGHALGRAGASPLEVAGHLVRGAAPGDTEAGEWLARAANGPAVDSRTAAALIARALEVNPAHPQRFALVRRLALLLVWQGRSEEAIPYLEQLLSEVSEIPERLAVIERLVNACGSAGRRRDLRSWVAQGAALAEQLDQAGRPEVLLLQARALFYVGDLEGALALTGRVAAGVGGAGGAVEAEANNQMSWLLTLRGRSSEALEHSARAVALPSSSAEVRSLYWRHHAWALGDMDRIEEAETALAVARSSAEEQGLAGVAVSILMESAHLRYSMGRWEEAAVDADTAAAIALELDGVLEADPEGVVLWIAYHRREGGERIREPRADAGSGDAFLETLEAVAASDRGDIDGACRSARGLLNRIGRIGSRNRREFDVLPPLVGISMGAGDTESAVLGRETAARLARGDAPGAALADARCRVIVDGDVAAARRAVDLARRSPRMLLAAEGLEDAAAVLPREDAVPVLEEASSLYEQIGAARDLARVAAKLKGLGARAPVAPVRARPVSGWEALTPAELEVVRLAADGLTNRQIGSRLFVSHRTVATHLSHVFDKLGVRSRVALAREAAQRFGAAEANG